MKNRSARIPARSLFWIVTILLLCACRGNPPSSLPQDGEDRDVDAQEEANRPDMVRFTESQLREFGISTATAGPGTIRVEVFLPGEVVLNADRIAHVVPRVPGIVTEVRKNLGDTVRRGEVMAVLESRELADATAALMAAHERIALAKANFAREEQVWRKKISPEQDYIEAKAKLAEATIELHTAEQKLRALGFSKEYVAQLSARREEATITYEMKAPIDGTVMEKHLSLGEVVDDSATVFVIADLSTVWVNLDIQQKDMPRVKVGQTAWIGIGDEPASIEGRIHFLEPTATETNRTIHARIVVPNAAGKLRPGLFINGRILVDSVRADVVVFNRALVNLDGSTAVFVKDNDGFRPLRVDTGITDGARTEIRAGLSPGQVYVDTGAFTVKSELEKPEAEE